VIFIRFGPLEASMMEFSDFERILSAFGAETELARFVLLALAAFGYLFGRVLKAKTDERFRNDWIPILNAIVGAGAGYATPGLSVTAGVLGCAGASMLVHETFRSGAIRWVTARLSKKSAAGGS
jgi:hypothetical protein